MRCASFYLSPVDKLTPRRYILRHSLHRRSYYGSSLRKQLVTRNNSFLRVMRRWQDEDQKRVREQSLTDRQILQSLKVGSHRKAQAAVAA